MKFAGFLAVMIAVMFLGIGALMFFIAQQYSASVDTFNKYALPTTALVVSQSNGTTLDNSGNQVSAVFPIVEFATAEGRKIQTTAIQSSKATVGTTINIFYLSNDPSKVYLGVPDKNGGTTFLLLALFSLAVALATLFVAWSLFFRGVPPWKLFIKNREWDDTPAPGKA